MTTLYTAEHEWITTDTPASATVGITVHAQDALGDVVFVDLPAVGATFNQGDDAGQFAKLLDATAYDDLVKNS